MFSLPVIFILVSMLYPAGNGKYNPQLKGRAWRAL